MHQRGMFAPLGHSCHWGDYLRSSAHRGFPSPQDRPAQTQPAPDRRLYLDVVWIGVPHFAARIVELVLLRCKVMRREGALGVDENNAPLLRHLLELLL